LTNPFKIKAPSKRQLSQFGYGAALICGAIAAWGLYKESPNAQWWLAGAGLSVVLTLFARKPLESIFRFWMTIGAVLGWINLHIIMALMLYLVFTPIRIIQKMIGRDSLHRKIDRNSESYLEERSPLPPDHFDRMY
jgi:Saxitoxin biosynthesis operon protein SxtJ